MASVYVTTPIYYVNDAPHIGHAYTTLACDVLARFKRLDGRDVHLPDRHRRARPEGREGGARRRASTRRPSPTRSSQRFRDLARAMNFSHDDFIRTTEPRHKRGLRRRCGRSWSSRGDIYLGNYAGWYSVRDEAFYDESELVASRRQGRADRRAGRVGRGAVLLLPPVGLAGPAAAPSTTTNPDFIAAGDAAATR